MNGGRTSSSRRPMGKRLFQGRGRPEITPQFLLHFKQALFDTIGYRKPAAEFPP